MKSWSGETDPSSPSFRPERAPPLTTQQQKRHVAIVGGMVVFFVTLIVMACLYFPHIPLPRF